MKPNLYLIVFTVLALVISFGCSPQVSTPTSSPPTASPIPFTATSSPTETSTPNPSPTPMLNPIAMGYHGMAYDIESDRIVLVAGIDNYCNNPKITTSIFDLATKSWVLLETTSSLPKGEGPMAYDTQSDRIIKFVGLRTSCTDFNGIGETWAYDSNTDTWENMHPSESPFGIMGSRMIYDSESDRMILFGGADAKTFLSVFDTWAYDYESNSWKNLQPANPPAWENFHAMSYDVAADRVIVWSGAAIGTENEIGIYDYNTNTWEVRETELHPNRYFFNAMVYDPGTGLNILFGGVNRGWAPGNETWGYDYASNSWKNLLAKNPPSARGWHSMAYDTMAGVMILFGGGTSNGGSFGRVTTRYEFTDETWVYDPIKNEWSNIILSP